MSNLTTIGGLYSSTIIHQGQVWHRDKTDNYQLIARAQLIQVEGSEVKYVDIDVPPIRAMSVIWPNEFITQSGQLIRIDFNGYYNTITMITTLTEVIDVGAYGGTRLILLANGEAYQFNDNTPILVATGISHLVQSSLRGSMITNQDQLVYYPQPNNQVSLREGITDIKLIRIGVILLEGNRLIIINGRGALIISQPSITIIDMYLDYYHYRYLLILTEAGRIEVVDGESGDIIPDGFPNIDGKVVKFVPGYGRGSIVNFLAIDKMGVMGLYSIGIITAYNVYHVDRLMVPPELLVN